METSMPESAGMPRCEAYIFDCFEASLTRGALLREGERLSVQDLPFRMLVALLERSGDIVTKEELAEQVWGRQIVGDTDRGLYIMAGKLRHALGDDANNPRYIKTVTGQGYRFIASVKPDFTPHDKPLLSPESPLLRAEGISDVGLIPFGSSAKSCGLRVSPRIKVALVVTLSVCVAVSI
jgi:DNA-binding winged helix-turn-helix (wHTH) protein